METVVEVEMPSVHQVIFGAFFGVVFWCQHSKGDIFFPSDKMFLKKGFESTNE